MEALFVLRVLQWLIALAGAVAHHLLARRWLGPLGASVASLLLWSTLIVFEKSIEIRPDTPAFALLQFALLTLGREGSVRRAGFASSLLGLGLLFTQKLVFPILGVMFALWRLGRGGPEPQTRRNLVMVSGLLWPTAACAVFFLLRGGLGAFIGDVFLINLRWKATLPAGPFFVSRFAEPNPFFAVVGGLGLLWGLLRLASPEPAGGRVGRMVFWCALSGALGVVVLPAAWEQYYLLFLPQLAMVGSDFLLRVSAVIIKRTTSSAGVALLVLTAMLSSLTSVRTAILNQRLRVSEHKEKAIAMILDNSSMADTVLDGYTGIGVFRPHAFRYFFLHAEMRRMLDGAVVRELEEGLADGAIAPRFVSTDSHLRAVSPRVRDFLDRNFAPAGVGPVAVRVFPGGTDTWVDENPRFPGSPTPRLGAYVLTLDGWSERHSNGQTTFRRSRGRLSTLLLPVLDPGRFFVLRLSARAGVDAPGLSARVTLNGSYLGEIPLGPAFLDFDLPLAPLILVRGLNRLEFSYPLRPAQLLTLSRVLDNSTLALESISLKRGRE
jgi:hypothetical protein